MDSDDDFMSGLSSDEDDALQDGSDNEDGSADGELAFHVLLRRRPTPGPRIANSFYEL